MKRLFTLAFFPFLLLLLSGVSFATSEAFKDTIFNPGKLKPVDSVLKVRVGDTAPDFTLANLHRKRISLSSFKGFKNVRTYKNYCCLWRWNWP